MACRKGHQHVGVDLIHELLKLLLLACRALHAAKAVGQPQVVQYRQSFQAVGEVEEVNARSKGRQLARRAWEHLQQRNSVLFSIQVALALETGIGSVLLGIAEKEKQPGASTSEQCRDPGRQGIDAIDDVVFMGALLRLLMTVVFLEDR